MATKDEIYPLLGRELLIKVRGKYAGSCAWYYVGVPMALSFRCGSELGVDFSKVHCVGKSHIYPLFTRKTGITVVPKHPGFFKLPRKNQTEIHKGGWFALHELEILEINKEEP